MNLAGMLFGSVRSVILVGIGVFVGRWLHGLVTWAETGTQIIAAVDVVLVYFAFSFQRMTLGIARKRATIPEAVPAIQEMMSPTWIGVLGWSEYLVIGLIWAVFGWLWAVGFFVASFLYNVVLTSYPLTGPRPRPFCTFCALRELEHIVPQDASTTSLIWTLKQDLRSYKA